MIIWRDRRGKEIGRIDDEHGLVLITRTKSGKITTNASGQYHISFGVPFIDTNYTVALSCQDTGDMIAAFKKNIAVNGFDIQTRNKNGHAIGNITVSWLATINYNPPEEL